MWRWMWGVILLLLFKEIGDSWGSEEPCRVQYRSIIEIFILLDVTVEDNEMEKFDSLIYLIMIAIVLSSAYL